MRNWGRIDVAYAHLLPSRALLAELGDGLAISLVVVHRCAASTLLHVSDAPHGVEQVIYLHALTCVLAPPQGASRRSTHRAQAATNADDCISARRRPARAKRGARAQQQVVSQHRGRCKPTRQAWTPGIYLTAILMHPERPLRDLAAGHGGLVVPPIAFVLHRRKRRPPAKIVRQIVPMATRSASS